MLFQMWVFDRESEEKERQTDRQSEREREREKATGVLGILFETPFPSLFECPRGSRLVSLKALKTPQRDLRLALK